MNIDIENINTIEKRHKVNTNLLSTTYEVIQHDFVYETDIFMDNFIEQCKKNANESHNITLDVKNNLKRMPME